ncbi:MAG: hypothetical protein HY866_10000, partial [Chloroflexi bacterium]|nr:hypothetical protein [Chloroflexota bacterium]
MLKLDDFLHLPQISTVFNEIVTEGTGLIIVAGLDPRPAVSGSPGGFLPSGRSTIFRILVREILTAQPDAECIVIAKDREAVRVPRQLRSRVKFWIAGS